MHVRIALCILAILIGASLGLLKVKDPVRFLLRLSCVQVAMFLIYRLCNYFLDFYIDDYSVGLAILRLIPLQLCYFSMLTTIIGLLIRNKTLINLGYLITPVCGIITVLFPDADFNGLSYANPTYFSFLAEHMLLIIIGIAIYSMGLYTPRYSDVPRAGLYLCGLAAVTYPVNLLCARFQLYPNYFYSYSTGGDVALEYFYSMLPVPLLYLIIPISISLVIGLIEISVYKICGMLLVKIRQTGSKG
jgi:uncharacterized membrane protein YwaF